MKPAGDAQFSCSYCLSSVEKKLRFRDIDIVKKELKFFIDNNTKQVKFVDRTFNCNHSHAMEIWKFIKENDNGITNFHFEIAADIMTKEEIELISTMRQGLIQLEIGVQSVNLDTLSAINRKTAIQKIADVTKKIKSYGNIHQHLDLIAGLPYEDYASFENSFNDVFNLGIEHLQLGFLKMIKGTGVRKTANEHGYKYKDYPPYEVLYNNYISYSQILKLKDIEEILEKYYNSKNFVLSMRYIIFNYYKESPFKFFEEFAIYFDKNGYFDVAQGKNQLYKILLDFYNESINKNNDLFNDILKYDYISLGKTSNIPQFFNKLDMEDFKNRCHVFLQDESNISKYLPNFENKPAKHIIKYVHFEPFKFDILELKKDINKNIDKEDNVVMFVYDDKKIFEKSKAYRVSI